MVPGKAENWIIIIDVAGFGITTSTAKILKGTFKKLQGNYHARLRKMYIVNASFGVMCAWQVLNKFISRVTKSKTQVCNSGQPKELLEAIHRSQLLKEYGGDFEAPKEAWPPTFPPQTYRDSYVETHFTENEFKEEVGRKIQIVPSPELAKDIKDKVKGGRVPEKIYYLRGGKNEKRDTFNSVIAVEEVKLVEFIQIEEIKKAIAEMQPSKKSDLSDINLEIKEMANTRPPNLATSDNVATAAIALARETARNITTTTRDDRPSLAEFQCVNSTIVSAKQEPIQARDFAKLREQQENTKDKKAHSGSKACCACTIM